MYIFQINYFFHIVLTILPFAILRYYPFKLRIKKRYFWSLYSTLIGIEGVIVIISSMNKAAILAQYNSGQIRILFYTLYFIISCIFIEENIIKHVFIWLLLAIFTAALFAFSFFIESLSKVSYKYFISNIVLLILWPSIHILGIRFIRNIIMPLLQEASIKVCILFDFLLVLLIIISLIATRFFPLNEMSLFSVFFIRFIVMLGGMICCIIFRILIYEQKLRRELEVEQERQEKLLALSKEQFQALSEKIEIARLNKHDLKHHFAAIENYIKLKDYEALYEYVSKSKEASNTYEILNFCKNHTFNIILSYYNNKALNSGIYIRIEARINTEVKMPDTDLWVLLGNLLENAFEGSLRLSPEKRSISVKIEYKANSIIIIVDNNCDESTIKYKGGKFFSSKKNDTGGSGIESVRLLANRYDGTAIFEVKNGKFLASICISNVYISPA